MKTPLTRSISYFFVAAVATLCIALPATSIGSSPGDGPDDQQALGISSSFGKWTGGVVTWVYDSDDAPAGWTDDNDTLARFQAALDEWAGYCNLTFVSLGIDDTADILNNTDGITVFAWEIIPAAGQAGPTISSSTETLLGRWNYIDGTLRMNPTVFEFAGGTASEQERNRIGFNTTAVHEIGHLIGLGHSDRPDSIMYSNPYNSITHTMQDDIEACRSIYGYSDVHQPLDKYSPPAAGTNSYSLSLTDAPPSMTPITVDDGAPPDDSDFVYVFWSLNAGSAPETLTQYVVDPLGYLATTASASVGAVGNGGWFSITSYGRLREMPGVWTYYLVDTTGHVGTLTFDVQTSLPDVNDAPDAELTFTEDPSTRAVALNTNVTGDAEGNNATIIWHIPGSSPITVDLMASSGSDARNVTFNDNVDWEIFAEVNDDGPRYTASGGNTADAGLGFQRLFRYSSTGVNQLDDHDGDNSSDILWRNSATGQNWLYSMAGNLVRASTGINTVTDTNWQIVGNGDYNGDGKADLLWRNSSTGQNWMYLMNGSTIASSAEVNIVTNQQWQVAGSGDYNGDGNSDILWRNSANGQNWVYFMNGSTISSSAGINTVSTAWNIAGSGDYDGDGNSDILWRHSVTGQVWMYLMNGSLFTSVEVGSVLPLWQIVGGGDYNGDGRSDILWRRASTGQNWVYFMNGATVSGSEFVSSVVDTNWQVSGSGDYNGDGNADIFWRNTSTGQNWVNLMDGSTITDSAEINRVSGTNWQVVTAN